MTLAEAGIEEGGGFVVMGRFVGQPDDDPSHVTLAYVGSLASVETCNAVFKELSKLIECCEKAAPSFEILSQQEGFGAHSAWVLRAREDCEEALQRVHACGDPSFVGQERRTHHITLKHPWSQMLQAGDRLTLCDVEIKCLGSPFRLPLWSW